MEHLENENGNGERMRKEVMSIFPLEKVESHLFLYTEVIVRRRKKENRDERWALLL